MCIRDSYFLGGDVRAVGQNVVGHGTGLITKVIVIDGESGHTAAVADTLLASDYGYFGGENHIGDQFGVGSGGVVGGDVDHIRSVAGTLRNCSHIVRVGERETLTGIPHFREVALDGVHQIGRAHV